MTKLVQLLLVFNLFLTITLSNYQPDEIKFANLIKSNSEQQRKTLEENYYLMQYAQWKADDMANRDYFSHKTPEGLAANYILEHSFSYKLPNNYGHDKTSNNVESLALNYQTPELALQALLDSEHHRCHLLGCNNFYKSQNEYGVGIAWKDANVYYVIVIARKK